MTAFVSDDDRATWKGGLLLDEREPSYPDGIQAEDGTFFIIYDHQRYTLNRAGKRGVGSVVLATFNEGDVRAARAVTAQSRLQVVITQLQKTNERSKGELKSPPWFPKLLNCSTHADVVNTNFIDTITCIDSMCH